MREGGAIDRAKGRIKRAAGALLGKDKLEREGRADQQAGKAKEKAGEVVDKVRDTLTGSDDSP